MQIPSCHTMTGLYPLFNFDKGCIELVNLRSLRVNEAGAYVPDASYQTFLEFYRTGREVVPAIFNTLYLLTKWSQEETDGFFEQYPNVIRN